MNILKSIVWQKYGYAIAIVLGMACLLIPAFINGYPILNPDIGTHLICAFTLETPGDRPLMYSLFIRVFTLNGFSMWGIVVGQAYIMSWLVVHIIKDSTNSPNYPAYAILTLVTLSITTSVSWITSELVPDVFTPIAILSIILILLGKRKGFSLFFTYFILFVAIASHLSHILIFTGLLICILLFNKIIFHKEQSRKKVYACLLMLAVCTSCIPLMQKPATTSGHAFLMASFAEKGVLKKYLDDHCAQTRYKICRYKDSMGTDPNAFLWEDASPMHQEGGVAATRSEYRNIIGNILSHYPYNYYFLQKSLRFTIEQLLMFRIGDGNFVFVPNTGQYEIITKYVPNDDVEFMMSLQNTGLLYDALRIPNIIIHLIVIISIVGMLLLSVALLKQYYSVRLLLFTCLLGIIINAFDCAAFAQVNGRYGCRVAWLIPLSFMIMLLLKRDEKLKQS